MIPFSLANYYNRYTTRKSIISQLFQNVHLDLLRDIGVLFAKFG